MAGEIQFNQFTPATALKSTDFVVGYDESLLPARTNIRSDWATVTTFINENHAPVIILTADNFTVTAANHNAIIICEHTAGNTTTITVDAGSTLPPNFKFTIMNRTGLSASFVNIVSASTNTFDLLDILVLANSSSVEIVLEAQNDTANFVSALTAGTSHDYKNVFSSGINYTVSDRDNGGFVVLPAGGDEPLVAFPINAVKELPLGFEVEIFSPGDTINVLMINSANPSVDTIIGKAFTPPGRTVKATKIVNGVNSTWLLDNIKNDKFWTGVQTGKVENALSGNLLNSGVIATNGNQLGSRVIKANSLIKGSSIILDFAGTYSTKTGSTGTIAFNVKMNGLVVATITPINPLANMSLLKWNAKIMCTFRDVGTIATDNARVLGSGFINFERIIDLMEVSPITNTGTVSIDTDVDITVEFEVVFTTADIDNKARFFNGIIYYCY